MGDGALPVVGEPSEDNIELPQEMCIEVDHANNERDLKTFCDQIYPNFEQRYKEEGYMEGRAILAPTNQIRDNINACMMKRLPTEEVVLLSADSTVQPGDSDRYPTEMLNSLQPQGVPAHKLVLRPGAPLRLMRNLNPKDGLCNGTRMVFVRVINNKILHCTIKDKSSRGGRRDVYIPRITLFPKKVEQFGFEWTRLQFPVCPAFAMTINASQGQTLKKVGVWLVDGPAFSHGQLYVAASRVGRPEDVLFAVKNTEATSAERNVTKNVVHREVLLHRRQPPPPQVPVPNTPAVPLESDHSSALDYNGVYDNRQEQAQRVSATLPSNVTLAALPTAREAEAAAGMERNADTHEAWIASLAPPSEAPLTPAEVERAAMIARRQQFMESLRDGTLAGDRVAAARNAAIFIN